MAYRKYQVLVRVGSEARWFEVLAIDATAVIADIKAAYGDIEVIQCGAL